MAAKDAGSVQISISEMARGSARTIIHTFDVGAEPLAFSGAAAACARAGAQVDPHAQHLAQAGRCGPGGPTAHLTLRMGWAPPQLGNMHLNSLPELSGQKMSELFCSPLNWSSHKVFKVRGPALIFIESTWKATVVGASPFRHVNGIPLAAIQKSPNAETSTTSTTLCPFDLLPQTFSCLVLTWMAYVSVYIYIYN